MSKGLIIPENLMALNGSVATAGSEASASMAEENLVNEEPSEFWRSTSNLQSKAWFRVTNDALGYLNADAFVLASHNMMRGDQYRIVGANSAPTQEYGYTAYDPTGTVAALCSNIADTANSHLLVDNGEGSPGATWLTGTASSWSVGLDFPTPGGWPVPGADRQAFWVYVKCSTASGVGQIRAEVYEGTTLKETSRTYSVGSTTGQWLCFPWDAANLASAPGDGVRAKIVVPSLTGTVSVGSVTFAADFTVLTGYDSGWLTYAPFLGSGIMSHVPQAQGQGSSALVVAPELRANIRFYVYLRVNNSPLDFDAQWEILPVPGGYAQVGCFILGESWSPATDRGHGPYIGIINLSSKGITDGGQVFGSRRAVLRTLTWPMLVLSKEEGNTVLDRILWRNSFLRKFYVHLAPGDSVEGTHGGFLATLKTAEVVMSTSPATEGNRSITLEFTEAL